MRRIPARRLVAAAAVAACCTAGCGGGGATPPAVLHEGAVVYRDALDDNHGGWLLVPRLVFFRHGLYEWRQVPPGGGKSLPDAELTGPIPSGIAVSVVAMMRQGAALRGVTCRELGPRDEPAQEWYELGVDGRRALIRRLRIRTPPKVLASAGAPIANGRRVRMTGACVPDGNGGLVLVLRLDGRDVLRARDPDPLPSQRDGLTGASGIFAYRRPDSHGPASLAWDDFELRRETAAASTPGQ
jgi:hypothetical protein